jgi:preprotein translocase subunit SecF
VLSKYKFDIVKQRNKFFAVSLAITLIGIISLLAFGLNAGVDFKAGTTVDIIAGKSIDKVKSDQIFKDAGLEPKSKTYGADRVSARYDRSLSQAEVTKVVSGFKTAYGNQVSKEENTVDTELAKELAQKAIIAVLLASLGIIIYVSIRFEWRFAIAAIVALLHDAFIVISLFSIFRLEVNLPFIAAILTIIGYSINDTIVIFDRIRENMRFTKIKSFSDLATLVNTSIWQVMTRSINTVLTVLLGAILLFALGGEGIRMFSLAMIFGLFCGMYSSIFIASPIWLLLKNKSVGARKAALAKE